MHVQDQIQTMLARQIAQPVTGLADTLDLARARVTAGFLVLNDRECLQLHELAFGTSESNEYRAAALELLFRANAPIALKVAVQNAHKHESFESAHSCAQIALHRCIARWKPKGGLKLGSFLTHVLAVEAERERKDAQLASGDEWAQVAVRTAMNQIEEGGRNRPHLTGYAHVEARVNVTGSREEKRRVLVFASSMPCGDGMVRNPLLDWFTPKVQPPKTFPRSRNWPRKTARAKTGYQRSLMQDASDAFFRTTFGRKNTSRRMKAIILGKPFRPLRMEDITPRMIQKCMIRDRELRQQAFDEKAWSVARIGRIMDALHSVTSYDQVLVDDEGDETRLSDFIYAPEREVDEREVEIITLEDGTEESRIKPEFTPQELRDAHYITERLMESGLWETAMQIPLDRFLTAHEDGNADFCALCSSYGVRVLHAKKIVKVINAHLAA